MLKTLLHDQIIYTARNVCDIDVTSAKKCRAWSDAASETFCICPKVSFHMTPAIGLLKHQLNAFSMPVFGN